MALSVARAVILTSSSWSRACIPILISSAIKYIFKEVYSLCSLSSGLTSFRNIMSDAAPRPAKMAVVVLTVSLLTAFL